MHCAETCFCSVMYHDASCETIFQYVTSDTFSPISLSLEFDYQSNEYWTQIGKSCFATNSRHHDFSKQVGRVGEN